MSETKRGSIMTIKRVFLDFLGLGFTLYILLHLVLILMYQSVTLMEPNMYILIPEITLMILIALFYIKTIKETHYEIPKGDEEVMNITLEDHMQ